MESMVYALIGAGLFVAGALWLWFICISRLWRMVSAGQRVRVKTRRERWYWDGKAWNRLK